MNRPMQTRNGAVIQSGLNPQVKGAVSPAKQAAQGLFQAVCLRTYTADDPNNRSGVRVECDVLLTQALIQLRRVPVRQLNHGRNNSWAPWIPRPSTRTISGAPMSFSGRSPRGTLQSPVSLLSDLDGDMLTVEFLEQDPERPIITGALTHPQNLRKVIGQASDADASLGWKEVDLRQGSPRRDELYFSHAGAEIRVNGQGDVLINTASATSDPVTESSAAAVGQMRVNVKNSQRFTVAMGGIDVLEVWKDGAQIRVDLGEGATERLLLGDAFKTYLDLQLAKVNTFWTSVFNAHVHGGVTTGVGLSAVPGTLQVATLDDVPDATLSDLAKTRKL